MASVNVAFEAPDNSGGPCPSSARPIDLVHLAKQTMGDKTLEMEVLQIFARQARACLQDIASGDADRMKSAAHRLKGAATAVGAFKVSHAASAIEDDVKVDAAAMAAVGAAVVEAENFVLKLCR